MQPQPTQVLCLRTTLVGKGVVIYNFTGLNLGLTFNADPERNPQLLWSLFSHLQSGCNNSQPCPPPLPRVTEGSGEAVHVQSALKTQVLHHCLAIWMPRTLHKPPFSPHAPPVCALLTGHSPTLVRSSESPTFLFGGSPVTQLAAPPGA